MRVRLASAKSRSTGWARPNGISRLPGGGEGRDGNALGLAQFGGKHPKAKPWKGQGPGVFEVVEDLRRRHLPRGLYGPLSGGRVRAARVPEKVSARKQDSAHRYRHGCAASEVAQQDHEARHGRASARQREEAITRGSGNVFADLGFPDAEERQTKLRLAYALNTSWTRGG